MVTNTTIRALMETTTITCSFEQLLQFSREVVN